MKIPEILPVGDQAIKIFFENKIDATVNQQVHTLANRITEQAVLGIKEVIPAFRTVTVLYEPSKIQYEQLIEELQPLMENLNTAEKRPKRIIELPVCYEEPYAPDIVEVAEHAGLSIAELIQRHSEREYLIYMLGFLPGFAYLGGLDPRIAMPRLSEPRLKIPAGSVGIAGHQTGVYPVDSPGGWRLIGSTPVKLFDTGRETPFLYEAGEYIRFVPIDKEAYEEIAQLVTEGLYQCKVRMEGNERGNPGN